MYNLLHNIEDSQGNNYLFYYKNLSIYCKTTINDESKESMIISQVSSDFCVTIDQSDVLYLVCSSRDKGILLFVYTNQSWNFEQIIKASMNTNLMLMYICILNEQIHILYSKRQSIENFYNIVHLYRSPSEVLWHKSSVSEYYNQKTHISYGIEVTNNAIHLVCVTFDGKALHIMYHCLNAMLLTWSRKNITALYNSNISVKLIKEENNLHLFCYAYENNSFIIYYFVCRNIKSQTFDFICLCDEGFEIENAEPLFYLRNGNPHILWIRENAYMDYIFTPARKAWQQYSKQAVSIIGNLSFINYIKSMGNSIPDHMRLLCQTDEHYRVKASYPLKETAQENAEILVLNERTSNDGINNWIEVLIKEMKSLSENIKDLSLKLDKVPGTTSTHQIPYSEGIRNFDNSVSHMNENKQTALRKNSNFKEKFMQNSSKMIKSDVLSGNTILKGNTILLDGEKDMEVQRSANNKVNLSRPVNSDAGILDAAVNEKHIIETVIKTENKLPPAPKERKINKFLGSFFK